MVCVFKHLYCSAQLSMSNMEKRYRKKIITIIIHCINYNTVHPNINDCNKVNIDLQVFFLSLYKKVTESTHKIDYLTSKPNLNQLRV